MGLPETRSCGASGAVGALMNRVHQPRTLLILGYNAGMGNAGQGVTRGSWSAECHFTPRDFLMFSLEIGECCSRTIDSDLRSSRPVGRGWSGKTSKLSRKLAGNMICNLVISELITDHVSSMFPGGRQIMTAR